MASAIFLLSIAVAIVVGTKLGFGYGMAAFFALFALVVAIRSNEGGE